MMPERTELWTYVGRRLGKNNKLFHAWLDENGNDQWFAKLDGTRIGSQWKVTVDDTSVFASGEKGPVWNGQALPNDDALVLKWAAEDRIAKGQREHVLLLKREAQTNVISEVCAPLREQYRKTIGSSRKSALLAAIIEEVTR